MADGHGIIGKWCDESAGNQRVTKPLQDKESSRRRVGSTPEKRCIFTGSRLATIGNTSFWKVAYCYMPMKNLRHGPLWTLILWASGLAATEGTSNRPSAKYVPSLARLMVWSSIVAFDVYHILHGERIHPSLLEEAVREVFANRGTAYQEHHPLFERSFVDSKGRQAMWQAFLKKIKYKGILK